VWNSRAKVGTAELRWEQSSEVEGRAKCGDSRPRLSGRAQLDPLFAAVDNASQPSVVVQFETFQRLHRSGVIPKSRVFTSGTRDLPCAHSRPFQTAPLPFECCS
jgi:hypothetical protein